MPDPPLTSQHLAFLQQQRVGRLATADTSGAPHSVPVCYACDDQAPTQPLYIVIDAKPKRVDARQLKRVRNILQNPQVALVVDHYSEDWSQLAYLLIHGTATLLDVGPAQQHAIRLLRARYPQYRAMPIDAQPVIAIRPLRAVAWGVLLGDGA